MRRSRSSRGNATDAASQRRGDLESRLHQMRGKQLAGKNALAQFDKEGVHAFWLRLNQKPTCHSHGPGPYASHHWEWDCTLTREDGTTALLKYKITQSDPMYMRASYDCKYRSSKKAEWVDARPYQMKGVKAFEAYLYKHRGPSETEWMGVKFHYTDKSERDTLVEQIRECQSHLDALHEQIDEIEE